MNMKRLAFSLVSILSGIVLTACNNSSDRSISSLESINPNSGQDSSYSEHNISNSSEDISKPESMTTDKITYNGATSGETFLKGLDGIPIDVSDITSLTDNNYKSVTELDEKSFGVAECNGFAYAFKPNLVYQKDDDPELFEEGFYIGEKVEPTSDYRRVSVGDEFNGLTVKLARTVFSTLNADFGDGNYYEGCELEFDGKITLTGWLIIPAVDEKYPDVVLDMTFYCDSNIKMPLSLSFYCNEKYGYYHIPSEGVGIFTDIPEVSLGKYPDYNLDFQGLTEGDAWVRAEITVTDVKMICGIQGDTGHVTATLNNITLL